jgi:hypothetical protein
MDKEIEALKNAVEFLNSASKSQVEGFLYYLTYRYMPNMVLEPRIKNVHVVDKDTEMI